MDDKRNSLLTIGLVCAVLLVLGVADLWNSDRVYSEAENRVLASRPVFSWESLFTGEYGDAYEEYMSDQFVGRDKWVGLKTRADIPFPEKRDQWGLSGSGSLSDRSERSRGIHGTDGELPCGIVDKTGEPLGCQSHAGTDGGQHSHG